MATATSPNRSAEFFFELNEVGYTAFPAFQENGGDIFNIVLTESDEFVDSMWVSPREEVSEAFATWTKTR